MMVSGRRRVTAAVGLDCGVDVGADTYHWVVVRGSITVSRNESRVVLRADPDGSAYCVMTAQDAGEIASIVTELARGLIGQSLPCTKRGIELPILRYRDLGGPDVKRLRDDHPMHRLLIPVRSTRLAGMFFHLIVRLRPILAHHERAGLNGHELHADGIGDGLGSGMQRGQRREQKGSEDFEGMFYGCFHCFAFFFWRFFLTSFLEFPSAL